MLDQLAAARRSGRPVALATVLDSGTQGTQALIDPERGPARIAGFDISGEAIGALRADRPCVVEAGDRRIFINVFNPSLRLVLVGAVHIAQTLAPMATMAGYRVTIIDPRGAFATAERFAGVELIEDWPDDYLAAAPPTARTAVVTLTHDPKLDDAALKAALRSDAFYIGSLGSKRTHAARLDRLKAEGVAPDALARIHAPVGLAIAARSPAEIAVAILAQITQTLRA